MRLPSHPPLLQNRLDIHDRKQFELKLEYQPSGSDPSSKYLIDSYLFIPASLNVDVDTYPRSDFYADIHNYVRLKTPVLSFEEILSGEHSPLVELEKRIQSGEINPQSELVYQAKMLSCVVRGALRRMAQDVSSHCNHLSSGSDAPPLEEVARESMVGVHKTLERFRELSKMLAKLSNLEERTLASLRLADRAAPAACCWFLLRAGISCLPLRPWKTAI